MPSESIIEGLLLTARERYPYSLKILYPIIFDEPNKKPVANCNAMNHMYAFVAGGISQPKCIE